MSPALSGSSVIQWFEHEATHEIRDENVYLGLPHTQSNTFSITLLSVSNGPQSHVHGSPLDYKSVIMFVCLCECILVGSLHIKKHVHLLG